MKLCDFCGLELRGNSRKSYHTLCAKKVKARTYVENREGVLNNVFGPIISVGHPVCCKSPMCDHGRYWGCNHCDNVVKKGTSK